MRRFSSPHLCTALLDVTNRDPEHARELADDVLHAVRTETNLAQADQHDSGRLYLGVLADIDTKRLGLLNEVQ